MSPDSGGVNDLVLCPPLFLDFFFCFSKLQVMLSVCSQVSGFTVLLDFKSQFYSHSCSFKLKRLIYVFYCIY